MKQSTSWMGHEYCVEVVVYGPHTERRIALGTRVSSLPVLATPSRRKIIGQNPEESRRIQAC
jgi:threonine dehydrogenase-like Zn-dependent dehydrogenase